MRIEHRTYPAQRKPAVNDRKFTKRGMSVRIPMDGKWKWASPVEVLNAGLEHLLSQQERHAARLAKDMNDALMFGLPNAEATHFTGLAVRGVEVRVAKPTAYFRKVAK